MQLSCFWSCTHCLQQRYYACAVQHDTPCTGDFACWAVRCCWTECNMLTHILHTGTVAQVCWCSFPGQCHAEPNQQMRSRYTESKAHEGHMA